MVIMVDWNVLCISHRFADAIAKEKRKFFKDPNNENVRVEFFPIEWRSKLVLDEGNISYCSETNFRVINVFGDIFEGYILFINFWTTVIVFNQF